MNKFAQVINDPILRNIGLQENRWKSGYEKIKNKFGNKKLKCYICIKKSK